MATKKLSPEEEAMKTRIRESYEFMDSSLEDMMNHPEVIAAVEDAIANLKRGKSLIGF